MAANPMRIPTPDQRFTITACPSRVVVTVAGLTIAETRSAISMVEGGYPPVLYIPRRDVDMSLLERSDHTTHCPYKGDCSYYSIPSGGARSESAVWSYEDPYPAVAAIKDHLAFYRDRVDQISVG